MIYKGIGGVARRIIAPYLGVGGKARRVMKSYIGVGGVAREIYSYLNDIDHVEVVLDRCATYTSSNDGEGWNDTLLGNTKAVMNANGSFSKSGNKITIKSQGNGTYCLSNYVYYTIYAVLKGGTKINLTYARQYDGKAVAVTITRSNLIHSGSAGYYYPFTSMLGITDDPMQTTGTAKYTAISNVSTGLHVTRGMYSRYVSCDFNFDSAEINGVTYSVTVIDALP